ncbi:NUDIX family Hydrolase [Thecamonas trahens ATCC 50062]|uniref:NUDIX family Hydrolase n=1 Tax=Thecamonas trahens ATCC 50062 TaxID=461836 RepID=A0A0L0DGM9_THETB|nr:NUDIX family Hydrolase [Thecamonas trahens ATCC 50062]KNC50488.1 NUDIX family Hydrolase [Thecamonas trahens ATCC 50062]|eukprot:XP_013762384.1 NUDIX family Hydrolase [Thecamonas trahens ATCC 50062]
MLAVRTGVAAAVRLARLSTAATAASDSPHALPLAELADDHRAWLARSDEFRDLSPQVHSAVGILLCEKASAPHLLLLHRAAHMRSHPNQLSLVGGRRDNEDASLAETLVREAEEEIGVIRGGEHALRLHGALPVVYPSLAGLAVGVFAGSLHHGDWNVAADESQALLEIPLADLVRPDAMVVESIQGYPGPVWHLGIDGVDVPLWGLTARILYDYFVLLDPAGATTKMMAETEAKAGY